MMTTIQGTGNTGKVVLDNQELATKEGFEHVSKIWYNKTLSYEQGLEQLEKDVDNREDIHSLWNNIDFTKNHFNTGVVLVRLAHESMYKNTDEPNNPYRIWLEGEYEKITRPQALGLLSELKKQERK